MSGEMREPTFLIMAALADKPRHGYGVQHEVHHMSHGQIRLKTSTLYAALDRLRTEAMVREVGEETVEGRLRRYYELTNLGRQALGEEVDRLTARAQEAHRRLALRPVTS